jgi:hypothetical protein
MHPAVLVMLMMVCFDFVAWMAMVMGAMFFSVVVVVVYMVILV